MGFTLNPFTLVENAYGKTANNWGDAGEKKLTKMGRNHHADQTSGSGRVQNFDTKTDKEYNKNGHGLVQTSSQKEISDWLHRPEGSSGTGIDLGIKI